MPAGDVWITFDSALVSTLPRALKWAAKEEHMESPKIACELDVQPKL